jgi:hypothetical protein
MRLVQYVQKNGERRVAAVSENGSSLQVLTDVERVYDLALLAANTGSTLEEQVIPRRSDQIIDYEPVVTEKRLLPPLDHPDPAHCLVTGTGLTHLGSAQARDAMHAKPADDTPLTDSMRMFQWGLEGGKPPDGQISVQPEWFYKGTGSQIVAPEHALINPPYALEGSEEAELVGLYVMGETGDVFRVGFALGNEFSDHVMEAQNYLYLAHSKLRSCSFGPEVRVGSVPAKIEGEVRIYREGQLFWQAPFLTGEANMSYRIANLEHHHFKYAIFRNPGDVHCHYFGTATLSRNAGVETQPGDLFEISAPGFGKPLRNTLESADEADDFFRVKQL